MKTLLIYMLRRCRWQVGGLLVVTFGAIWGSQAVLAQDAAAEHVPESVGAPPYSRSTSGEGTPANEITLVNGQILLGWVLSETAGELRVLLSDGELIMFPSTLVQSIEPGKKAVPESIANPAEAKDYPATTSSESLKAQTPAAIYKSWQDASLREAQKAGRHFPADPGAALTLSLFGGLSGFHGLGQAYNREPGKALVLFVSGLASSGLIAYGWVRNENPPIVVGAVANISLLIIGVADAHNSACRQRFGIKSGRKSVSLGIGATTAKNGAPLPSLQLKFEL